MDEDEYPLTVIVDRIRDYLHQAGLLDTEEFDAGKDDVTDLAHEIISEVETSYGMWPVAPLRARSARPGSAGRTGPELRSLDGCDDICGG